MSLVRGRNPGLDLHIFAVMERSGANLTAFKLDLDRSMSVYSLTKALVRAVTPGGAAPCRSRSAPNVTLVTA